MLTKNRKAITLSYLQGLKACQSGVDYWQKIGSPRSLKKTIEHCLKHETHLNDCNWLIVRCMTHKIQIRYAVYAAELVLDIYESRYHGDNRPRKAIEAAKLVIDDDTPENRSAAAHAAHAAYAAAYAAYAARINMQKKILIFGLELIYGKKGN